MCVNQLFFFSWSGLRDYIACSLLGGIIPSQNSGYKVTRLCPYFIRLLFRMLVNFSQIWPVFLQGSALRSAPLLSNWSAYRTWCAYSPPPLLRICLRLRFRIRIRRCWLHHSFLCRLKVYPLMLPLPPRYPFPQPLHGPLTEFHNRSRRNVLRNLILPTCDGLPNTSEPRLSHGLLQKRVCPLLVPPSPRLSSGHPARNPVLEAL